MVLVWENFTVDESIYFPKFRIDEYYALDECETEPERRSCIRGVLALSRKVSFYVTRFYAPTFLITTATFISYWISAGETAPRIVINMTPFLTLVTLHNALNNEINVSYVVALHIWMFACMFYTFMGLVVLFFGMQLHAAEMKKQEEQEKKRLREENNNLFRKFSRAVSDPAAGRALDEQPEERAVRRRSTLIGTKIETPVWMDNCPTNFRAWWTRVRVWFKRQWKRMTRLGSEEGVYLNTADRIARVLAPTTFAVFTILYFVFFYCYYEEHVTGSGW